MAILKFEPPKERAFLRVKIARDVHERVERYVPWCALVLLPIARRELCLLPCAGATPPPLRR